jgi:hypothetical protein
MERVMTAFLEALGFLETPDGFSGSWVKIKEIEFPRGIFLPLLQEAIAQAQ